jgi:hypothetical protein
LKLVIVVLSENGARGAVYHHSAYYRRSYRPILPTGPGWLSAAFLATAGAVTVRGFRPVVVCHGTGESGWR